MTESNVYFIGNSCHRRHAPLRYKSSGDCVQCKRDSYKSQAIEVVDDDIGCHEVLLDQLSERFLVSQRKRHGISAEQAAADRLLLADVRSKMLTETLKASVEHEMELEHIAE